MENEAGFYKSHLADAIRRHVGRGGVFRVEEFSDETGIAPRRVYAMRDEQAVPTLPEIIQMARVLPSDFIAEVLRPAGVNAVTKDEEVQTTASGAQTSSKLTLEAAHLANAFENGEVDPREHETLIPEIERLQDDIGAFLTLMRRKRHAHYNITSIRGGAV